MYTDKLFTGQRQVTGLGIYHYQSRFYSPKLGRFLSVDSIVPNPFNPQTQNRYSYVYNNPMNYVDPTGHIGCKPGQRCINNPKVTASGAIKKAKLLGEEVASLPSVIPSTSRPAPVATKAPKPSGGGKTNGGGTLSTSLTLTPTSADNTPDLASAPTIVSTQTPTPPLGWTPMPEPDIDLPSVVDAINFLFEPGPAGDTLAGDLVQAGADSSPMIARRIPNPLFGQGRAISEAVDAVGVFIYFVVNYGEVRIPWGTPPPIYSTPDLYAPIPTPAPRPETGTPIPP